MGKWIRYMRENTKNTKKKKKNRERERERVYKKEVGLQDSPTFVS